MSDKTEITDTASEPRMVGVKTNRWGQPDRYGRGDTQTYLLPTALTESGTVVLIGKKKTEMAFVNGKNQKVPVTNYPGQWVIIGGGGKVGSSVVKGAYLEFEEETGIGSGAMELLGTELKVIDKGVGEWACVITKTSNASALLKQIEQNLKEGLPTIQDDELESVEWVSVAEARNRFDPKTMDWFHAILDHV